LADDAILLNDSMQITYRGKKLSLDLTHRCQKDNFLSPVRIESKEAGDDEFGTFVVTIDGEKATVRSDGREREMELPKRGPWTVGQGLLQWSDLVLPHSRSNQSARGRRWENEWVSSWPGCFGSRYRVASARSRSRSSGPSGR
jgi:hypothetical protein